jgi:hypothetical protein
VRFEITVSVDQRTLPEAGVDSNLYFIPQLFEFDDDDRVVVGEPIYQGPRQAFLRSDADTSVLFRVPINLYHTDPLQANTYDTSAGIHVGDRVPCISIPAVCMCASQFSTASRVQAKPYG